MMLMVDLCWKKNSLSRPEFVDPVASALRKAGAEIKVLHYSELTSDQSSKQLYRDLLECDGVVLCGTAIQDNFYAKEMDKFSWLKDPNYSKPVLGICAGMQVIASAFGGKIIPRPVIGMEKVDIIKDTELLGEPRQIEGYHLHNYGAAVPKDFHLVAGSPHEVDAFVHERRPIYGLIFHPEVRNRWIIQKFIELVPNH
jgi:GMP synthase-like glutamine amidotransferase